MASVSWYSLSIALFLFFLAFLFTKHIHGELYQGFCGLLLQYCNKLMFNVQGTKVQ